MTEQQPAASSALPLRHVYHTSLPTRQLSNAMSSTATQTVMFGYEMASAEMTGGELQSPITPTAPANAASALANIPRQQLQSNAVPASIPIPGSRPNMGLGYPPSITPAINAQSRRAYRAPSFSSGSDVSISSQESPKQAVMAPKKDKAARKPVDGDCSICWEPFDADNHKLVFCKLVCGNNFHKQCFVDWLIAPKHQRASPDLRCPYCRGAWDPEELRSLQVENGLLPHRPHKRPRPDHSRSGNMNRDNMRRFYRERHVPRRSMDGGVRLPDRWRPGMYDSYVPTGSFHSPYSQYSMRMPPGPPPSTPQASPPADRHPQYMPYRQAMPMHPSFSNGAPSMSLPRNHQVNSGFNQYYSSGLPFVNAMAPMQTPQMQPHEHNLPAHSLPPQNPTQIMNMHMQQHMQRAPQPAPNPNQMQTLNPTLPPIQTLPQAANMPYHTALAMELELNPTPYCFGLEPMGSQNFGAYLHPLGYNGLYSFAGPSGS